MDFESARAYTHRHTLLFFIFWSLVYILKSCPLVCQLTMCCYYVPLPARISPLSLLSQARVDLRDLCCFCRVFLSRPHWFECSYWVPCACLSYSNTQLHRSDGPEVYGLWWGKTVCFLAESGLLHLFPCCDFPSHMKKLLMTFSLTLPAAWFLFISNLCFPYPVIACLFLTTTWEHILYIQNNNLFPVLNFTTEWME